MELSPFSRVTSNLQSNTILQDLGRNMEALFRVQQQIASGKRITRPSADPVGTNSVLEFQDLLERHEQYVRNIDGSIGRLSMADSALTDIGELLIQAKELAIEQANDITATADTRLAASRQLGELINEVVSIANRRFGGRYIFAGSETGTAPFLVTGIRVIKTGTD